MKSKLNMRIFLLAGLLAAATACDKACVAKIYDKVKAVDASFKDGDKAIYGYGLYKGAVNAATPELGFAFVDTVLGYVGTTCGTTRATIATCISGATDADVTKIETEIAKDATNKAHYEAILGAIANQLAPGSKPAKKWKGLTATEFETALKVFYIVKAFGATVKPAIDASFAANTVAKDKCYDRLETAVGYTAGTAGTYTAAGDLAALTATKGTELFGTAGLKHDDCFGAANSDFVAPTTPAYADLAAVTTATDAALKTANADVTRVKGVGQPTAAPVSSTSPAAALSAAIAAVALMF